MSEITSAKPVICDRCGEAIDFRIFPAAIHVVGEKNYHIGCVARVQDPRDAEITSLRAQLENAQAENRRLVTLVYVPGLWRCAKCEFQLIQANLNAGDGSVTARDQAGDKCPNCDVPLWRVTEREAGNKLIDDAERVCMETAARIDETRRKAIEECAAIADRWTSPEQRLHGHGGAGAEILALLSESKS